jgi:hypothetical protein
VHGVAQGRGGAGRAHELVGEVDELSGAGMDAGLAELGEGEQLA